MTDDDLPEWGFPYLDEKYTGAYWSDGKWQSSVPDGKTKPNSRLDKQSRIHDTSYYYCAGDLDCNDMADREYRKRTSRMSFVPRTIGQLPQYFHKPKLRGNARIAYPISRSTGGENKMKFNVWNNRLTPSALAERITALQRKADDATRAMTRAEAKPASNDSPQIITTTYSGDGLENEIIAGAPTTYTGSDVCEVPFQTATDTNISEPSVNALTVLRKLRRRRRKKRKYNIA
jgi:hypothetical protein